MKNYLFIFLLLTILGCKEELKACSILYYVDPQTGNIYVANNEDYWYDVNAYIQIMPSSNNQFARLWYGWDKFAQGGINEKGLFFDGAVTPKQSKSQVSPQKGNLGDKILASCTTVEEALSYLNEHQVFLADGHMMFGDASGNAVVVEWLDEKQQLTWLANNKLVMTNFLLSDTTKGNYPCYRYNTIQENLRLLDNSTEPNTLLKVGNCLGKTAQPPKADENGRIGGTLYSTFIDITNMQFFLAYKLDNSKVTKLDLKKVFEERKKRKINLR